jgi:hypothetical protein
MNVDDHYLPDLRPYSKINIGGDEPVWVYVSHDRVDVSNWLLTQVEVAA